MRKGLFTRRRLGYAWFMVNLGFPPIVRSRLSGWQLIWFALEPLPADEAGLSKAWDRYHMRVRERFSGGQFTNQPRVQAIRKRFRQAGTDPTRYRPSSEALLRRVLKGSNLPRIHPLVDLNNLLSLELLAPCCVMELSGLKPPFTLRAGQEGESMDSLRGPFNLEGKPLLADEFGPFGTPITDSERVRVRKETRMAWLVVYLPDETEVSSLAARVLSGLLADFPVASLLS